MLPRRKHRSYLAPTCGLMAMAIVCVFFVAGCSNAGKAAASVTKCGTSRTAANVPVTIRVNTQQVSCSKVLTIEGDYAKAIQEGKAPGNGGGGPVKVDGWTCEGFPTPEVLKTGNVSRCVKASMEILASLSTPG